MTKLHSNLKSPIERGERRVEVPTGIWLGTTCSDASDGRTFAVDDPATGEVIAQVADATRDDWMKSLELADRAAHEWAKTPARTRSEVLRSIFEAVTERTEEFATVMSMEMGKPLQEARGEVAYGAEYFRWFAEESVRSAGRFAPAPQGNGSILVTREPVGPVLAITPWNFPLAMATRKIAPALAAGCPIIVKPAAETPLTMLLLGEVIAQVLEKFGIESAVVSTIPTTNAAEMSRDLMGDPRLRKVSFTGSTDVGKILVRQSSERLQRTSMELGGNAPFVIAEDANLDLVIDCAWQAKMRNGGQACIAANRFLIHEKLAPEFVERITSKMDASVMGHGLDEGTTLGPMITRRQRDRIAELVEDAVEKGARKVTQQEPPADDAGYFYPPTVLVDVPEDARILHEEIFGPVVTVSQFCDLDDAIQRANCTPFGLAAYGFSENVHTARKLASELHAGMVGINRGAISEPAAPFGGIKESGFGREGGSEGIEEYLETKYVAF